MELFSIRIQRTFQLVSTVFTDAKLQKIGIYSLFFRDLLHYDAKFLCQMFDVSIGMLCKFCMLIVLID